MLGELKKVAARAKDDVQYTLIGDTGRTFFHRLNNLIGSDRPLYQRHGKYTYTDADCVRWGKLAARTKIELARAKFVEAKRTEAIANRANTDALNVQANSEIAKALSYVRASGCTANSSKPESRPPSRVNGAKLPCYSRRTNRPRNRLNGVNGRRSILRLKPLAMVKVSGETFDHD